LRWQRLKTVEKLVSMLLGDLGIRDGVNSNIGSYTLARPWVSHHELPAAEGALSYYHCGIHRSSESRIVWAFIQILSETKIKEGTL
jgi:hypothetical protein